MLVQTLLIEIVVHFADDFQSNIRHPSLQRLHVGVSVLFLASYRICLLFAAERVVYEGFFGFQPENSCLLQQKMAQRDEREAENCCLLEQG